MSDHPLGDDGLGSMQQCLQHYRKAAGFIGTQLRRHVHGQCLRHGYADLHPSDLRFAANYLRSGGRWMWKYDSLRYMSNGKNLRRRRDCFAVRRGDPLLAKGLRGTRIQLWPCGGWLRWSAELRNLYRRSSLWWRRPAQCLQRHRRLHPADVCAARIQLRACGGWLRHALAVRHLWRRNDLRRRREAGSVRSDLHSEDLLGAQRQLRSD